MDEIEDLILWLPDRSAFRSSFQVKKDGDPRMDWIWSDEKELLLSVINLLITQTHVIQQVQSAKKIKPPESVPSPRDQGQKPAQRPDADNQARAMLAAAKARRKGT